MAASKKDPGVLLRLPQELHERVAAWSSETGKTIHELLLDAIQRSFLAWPEEAKEKAALTEENEVLKRQIAALTEALRSYYPEEQPAPKITPRRTSPEEQKKALQDAQRRLELLRAEKRSRPTQLPTSTPADVAALREVEASVRQVATEMLSPRSSLMSQKRSLAQRGRVEGVAYEEADELRPARQETARKPPHIKEPLQKKAEELVRAQRLSSARNEPPPGSGRKKP